MDILVFLQHLPEVVYIIFKISSLVSILSVQVSVTLFVLDFFLHIFFVQSYDTFLQLFEVGNMSQGFEDIVLELLLVRLLLVQISLQVLHFIGQTFLPHSEIVDNQS